MGQDGGKPWRFVEDTPEPAKAGRGPSLYMQVLDDFKASDMRSVRVELEGKEASNVYSGLFKARKNNAERYEGLRVTRRGDDVYLTKE